VREFKGSGVEGFESQGVGEPEGYGVRELKPKTDHERKPQIEAKNMSCYSLPNLYNAPDCLTFGGNLAGTHIDFPSARRSLIIDL
jgi:hypothetical protein